MYNKSMPVENIAKILKEIRHELAQQLGERLESVYLYGSRARGDARVDSDIDLLIVIRGEFDYFELLEMTSYLIWRYSLENNVVISRAFISNEQFHRADTPFLMNIQREAVPV